MISLVRFFIIHLVSSTLWCSLPSPCIPTVNALAFNLSPRPQHIASLLSSTTQSLSRTLTSVTIHAPPVHDPTKTNTALVLLPGCLVHTSQYDALVASIQQASQQNVWVAVPKLPLEMANPIVVPYAIQRSMDELREAGYNGNKVFLGGHSLGAVFIPDFLEQWKDEVAGVVMLGAFHQRHGMSVDVPSLTLCGELDGLVRTSRIAESFHQNIIQKGNTEEQRLRNPIVLIEGMNHFQILEGDPHPMKQLRDLPAETDDETAKKEVSTTIANFLDVHNFDCKEAKNDRSILDVTKNHKQRNDLMSRVARTGEYLDPLIQAMKLEGNYHVDSSIQGCPLTEQAQKDILSGLPSTHHVKDQFRKSWYCNPFDKVPFSHPKVASVRTGSDEQQEVDLLTYSEAIYNNLDKILDTGFFSNTASEIQAKLNSPQAVLDAMGETTEYDPSSVHDIARRLNEKTITWALENVPEAVRQRYLERGIPVVTGSDIPHSSGPAWIWSFLKLQPEIQTDSATGESREVRVVQSHILSTPVDHPLTFLSGKMYCKLLSPAKVMEWMYTDSLREKNEFSLKNLFGGDRGTSPHHSDRNMGAGVFMTTDSAH